MGDQTCCKRHYRARGDVGRGQFRGKIFVLRKVAKLSPGEIQGCGQDSDDAMALHTVGRYFLGKCFGTADSLGEHLMRRACGVEV